MLLENILDANKNGGMQPLHRLSKSTDAYVWKAYAKCPLASDFRNYLQKSTCCECLHSASDLPEPTSESLIASEHLALHKNVSKPDFHRA